MARSGIPIVADTAAAVGAGHAWLQMVGMMPLGLPPSYSSGFSLTDGDITFSAFTRRSWARSRSAVRRPRTLLVSGNPASTFGAALLAADLGDFEDAGIDVVMVNSNVSNAAIAPLVGVLPLTNATSVSIQRFGYLRMSVRASAGYEGGELYHASLGGQRMAFGSYSAFSMAGLASGDPTLGTNYHSGYVFAVNTTWGSENPPGFQDDPGPQSFTGCTEVGSELGPANGTDIASRIQTFLNTTRAEEDMDALADYAEKFDKLRVAFWGLETVASYGGSVTFPSTGPEIRNPGTPATVAATIDGGNGLVTYHACPSDDGVFIGSNTATAILSDARNFFGL